VERYVPLSKSKTKPSIFEPSLWDKRFECPRKHIKGHFSSPLAVFDENTMATGQTTSHDATPGRIPEIVGYTGEKTC
jgi:hypothetical protein